MTGRFINHDFAGIILFFAFGGIIDCNRANDKNAQGCVKNTFITKKYAAKNASGNDASEPNVPGALRANPTPNNVAIKSAIFFFIVFLSGKFEPLSQYSNT